MQIKGIKRGNIIELLEVLEIPDDTEILIEVQVAPRISDEERWEKMKAFLPERSPQQKRTGESLKRDRVDCRLGAAKRNPTAMLSSPIATKPTTFYFS